MKILITGVAGYIGSNVADYFLSKQYEVVGLDNFNDYYPREIKEFNISEIKNHENFKLYEIDITDVPALSKIFEENQIDAVIHLAAWAGVTPSVKNPHIYAEVNYVGTDNVALQCVNHNVKNFIFASTSSVYGNLNNVPFVETMDTSFVAAPYPASKKSAEVLLYTYSLNFDLNVTVMRIFNPLGLRQRPDTAMAKLVRCADYGYEFPIFMNADKGGRDYTSLYAMIEAMESAVKNSFKYEIFNLGNSKPRTILELISATERVTGKKVKTKQEPRPGQMEITCADITKARKMLNYNPTSILEDMFASYYEWHLKQPEWYKKLMISK